MDPVAKNFVRMALIYFSIAAVIGAFLLFCRAGRYQLFYAHVHLNLLGWVSMMIYGVGYHIIPRFNGNQVAFPKLAIVHFWVANIALIGLVSVWGHGGAGRIPEKVLVVLNVVAVGMFVFNMLMSMRKPKDDD